MQPACADCSPVGVETQSTRQVTAGQRAHVLYIAGALCLVSWASMSPLNNSVINLQSRLSDGKAHWSSNSFA